VNDLDPNKTPPSSPLPPKPQPVSLKATTLVGLRWSAATQVGCQVLRLAVTVVLARILSPRDFGLAAMLFAFAGFVRVFTSSGFGPSIVQKQNLRAEHLNTIFG
jgi:O-antigen/teichoic acid export membrane protein